MVWLHRTDWCHICCHHHCLRSHTYVKRKKRKNESFDTFNRKNESVLQECSSFFKNILSEWGGSRTLWPLWALRVPVCYWIETMDIPVFHLKLIPDWITSLHVLFLACMGKDVWKKAPISTNNKDSVPDFKKQTFNFQAQHMKQRYYTANNLKNFYEHHFVYFTVSKSPSLCLTASIYIKMSLPHARVMQHLCWSELIEICNVVQQC